MLWTFTSKISAKLQWQRHVAVVISFIYKIINICTFSRHTGWRIFLQNFESDNTLFDTVARILYPVCLFFIQFASVLGIQGMIAQTYRQLLN